MKHLRDFVRSDMKTFKIVLKKIIELSQGQFTKSNQQRLMRSHDEIAMFDAKVSGGMHLIYQIDLQADSDLKVSFFRAIPCQRISCSYALYTV